MAKIWRSESGFGRIVPKTIIWTNVPQFAAKFRYVLRKFKAVEIMHIDTLFGHRDNMRSIIRSFIQKGEFAFASDILRYIILRQYGRIYINGA
ncbi:MAG: hypothetical protein GY718_04790 [Lentisphaerae bacterium]|nr:hypothetical protein [Lentisphaerota bacterium]